MENLKVKAIIADVFEEIAQGLETGLFHDKVALGLTLYGSELGASNLLKGAETFAKDNADVEVVLIGPKVETDLTLIEVESEELQYDKMEELLDSGRIQGCVTMHYSFPIGVSTVGRTLTPGFGKEMYVATTTGTSSAHRNEAMVKNAISGIIAAKAAGIQEPSLGILNVDGARTVERALKELSAGGYPINFADSDRSDGGCVMRGNDLLRGTPDIMVTDTLTGNILMKTFSSYHTGGNFEAVGDGYGPGIGQDFDRLVLILSRVSGSPVVANALAYAKDLVLGDVHKLSKKEYKKAKDAGLEEILAGLTKTKEKAQEEEVTAPAEEITTGEISGIDILELEDAVRVLWKEGIYASSGMGCTGPVVMVNESKIGVASQILAAAGYVSED
ncbi:MAG TPA: glycine/sarcosine/betaine reductase complex component C subunit alpha [Clostridia bacterium]|nr:glycine/sarcosine/betaine reductase complex component C subunit alpha [Clostridia bacterium]